MIARRLSPILLGLIALVIATLAVFSGTLYWVTREPKVERVSAPPTDLSARTTPTPSVRTPVLPPESVVERSEVSVTAQTPLPVETSTIIEEEAPPVGSEPPVPSVYGLVSMTNATNVPYSEGFQGIAEEFTEQVKQGGWDNTSAAYKKNWEKAAERADDLLRARYGEEVYLKMKREAAP
jgi:hypothetical protein